MGDKNSGSGEMAVVSLVLLLVAAVSGLDNGLVRVPWMGFSTWEVFRDHPCPERAALAVWYG
jgi:hypothetical protein